MAFPIHVHPVLPTAPWRHIHIDHGILADDALISVHLLLLQLRLGLGRSHQVRDVLKGRRKPGRTSGGDGGGWGHWQLEAGKTHELRRMKINKNPDTVIMDNNLTINMTIDKKINIII